MSKSKALKTSSLNTKELELEIGPILTPANGQGIVFFTTANASEFHIYVTPEKEMIEEYFRLRVNTTEAVFDYKLNTQEEAVTIRRMTDATHLVDKGMLTTYWLSFSTTYCESSKTYIPDLRYGKGFAMEKTTLMHEKLQYPDIEPLFTVKTVKYARVFQDVVRSIAADEKNILDLQPRVYQSKTPLTVDPSPVAIDSATASMMDIDLDRTLSTMLPDKARILFDTVKNFELDEIIVNAIRFSLITPGMTLYTIAEKKGQPSGDGGFLPDQVYIRVTVGKDSKIGPGIPFVLEIWPSGMKSPIHDHGDAVAVIKVLHGEINIDIYNKLIQPRKILTDADILQSFAPTKGQFTWMDKNWYQCHQLKNVTDDYCATIQCYLYDDSDRVHWPGFDYIEVNSKDVEIFNPESDLDYKVMLHKVLQEYYQHEYPKELKDLTVFEGPRQRKKRKLRA